MRRLLLLAGIIGAAVLLIYWWHVIMHWAYWHFGVNGTGPYYGFFSGAGSDISELALIAVLWKMINCYEPGCWRLGLHYKGHVVCYRHRPGVEAEQTSLLREIHRHVQALSPHAGQFTEKDAGHEAATMEAGSKPAGGSAVEAE